MKVVINRTGNILRFPEYKKEIPWDGKKYIVPDNIAEKYRGYLEVIDIDKSNEIDGLKHEIRELTKKLGILTDETKNNQEILNNLKKDIKVPRIDFLYSFHFNEDQNEAINRLRHSIKSIIEQKVNVCVCNTSKNCIYKKIKGLGKIKYYHEPLDLEIYCKSKTINLGVKQLINSDYFFLSDIDLFYHPDYVNCMGLFWMNRSVPVRVVGYNNNLGPSTTPLNIEECKKIFLNSKDNFRTKRGIAPGNGLIHRKSYDKILGFDERYIGYGPEDADFNYRITKICNYIAVDIEELNTYHFFHKNPTVSTIEQINNSILYTYIKEVDIEKKYNIIKSGEIIIPKKLLAVNDDTIKEIMI